MSMESSGASGGKDKGGRPRPNREDMFEPVPYTIRISNKWRKVRESSTLPPPDWLLLDHTIAVVWSLFSPFSPAKALDIEDLKWAHDYLKQIRNSKGENPPDVKTCLKEIQDRLIAQYAQMTPFESISVKKPDQPQPSDTKAITVVKPVKDSPESREIPRENGNAIEIPSAENTFKMEKNEDPAKDATKAETQKAKKLESTPKERTFARETKKSLGGQQRRPMGVASKSTPIQTKRSKTPRKENLKKEDENQTVDNYLTEVYQKNKNDRIPGSHNLARKKTNAAAVRSTLSNEDISGSDVKKDSIQTHADDGKISLQFKKFVTAEEINEEQAYKILKNEIRNLTNNPKISKEEVLKFLCNWREEQEERLQSELKRLHSIEEFMKHFKTEGFVPYMPDTGLKTGTENEPKETEYYTELTDNNK